MTEHEVGFTEAERKMLAAWDEMNTSDDDYRRARPRVRGCPRQRSTRRGRVAARVSARHAASTGGDSGDDPAEPPHYRRCLDQEAAP